MIYEDIISAVDMHRKAMELVVIGIFIVHIMLAVLIRKIANILFCCNRSQEIQEKLN